MNSFQEYRVTSASQRASYILPSSSEMRQLDATAISHGAVTGEELMLRAGSAIAKRALERFPNSKRALIFAGTGNNGGDGLVIGKFLKALGIQTDIIIVPGSRYSDLFLVQLAGMDTVYLAQLNASQSNCSSLTRGIADIITIGESELKDIIVTADLIFDALLGTGQSGAPKGAIAASIDLISKYRSGPSKVVAVDIPTGINSDSGAVYSPHISANATYAVQFIKRGMMQFPARAECGVLEAIDIGISGSIKDVEFSLIDSNTVPPPPARAPDVHKGELGRVLVIGGSFAMPGAPMLAALGALRAGAGIVSRTIRSSWSTAVPLPEAIFEPFGGAGDSYNWADLEHISAVINHYDTLVIGPGIGFSTHTCEFVAGLIDLLRKHSETNGRVGSKRIILDADALNIIASEGIGLSGLSAIITPHPGEAARLLGCSTEEIQDNRFASVRTLAEKFGVVALLKGAGTLIYTANAAWDICEEHFGIGRGVVVAAGTPYLATPGSGDILSGVIAGLVAQGVRLYPAAVLGAWLHAKGGLAASAKRGGGVILASDIIIGSSWNRVGKIGIAGREHARGRKGERTRKRVVTRHALKAKFRKHGTNPSK